MWAFKKFIKFPQFKGWEIVKYNIPQTFDTLFPLLYEFCYHILKFRPNEIRKFQLSK